MLKIKQLQTKINPGEDIYGSLISSLGKKYGFLIYGIKKDYINKLNIKLDNEFSFITENLSQKDNTVFFGDMLFMEPDTIIYYKVKKDSNLIEIGIIGDPINRDKFENFARDVLSVLRKGPGDASRDWESVKTIDPSVQSLLDETVSIVPVDNEIVSSLNLLDQKMLDVIRVINQQDSVFQETLLEKTGLENVDREVKLFKDLGLINSDFALLCNKTGQQILRVPDKSALEDISKKGFNCFICGSSIADEKLVRAISISDFGRRMLRDDYWILVHTLSALKNVGFSYEDLFVLKDENLDARVLLNLNDESMMIQLANRKLSLDDAYLINAHISAYSLDYFVIVSVKPISSLMKGHLRDANPDCRMEFIEGLDTLEEDFRVTFLEIEKARMTGILTEMSSLTPISMENLVLKKVVPEGRTELDTGFSETVVSAEPVKKSPDMLQSKPRSLITDVVKDKWSEDIDLESEEVTVDDIDLDISDDFLKDLS
jgi:hypothetical protein